MREGGGMSKVRLQESVHREAPGPEEHIGQLLNTQTMFVMYDNCSFTVVHERVLRPIVAGPFPTKRLATEQDTCGRCAKHTNR
jgi:hypothetical protein